MKSRSVIDIINHHNYTTNGRDAIVDLRTDGFFQDSLVTLMRRFGVDDRPFWADRDGPARRRMGTSGSTTTTCFGRFGKSSG